MEELKKAMQDAEQAEQSGDFFGASFLYKETIKIAQKENNSDLIKVCKRKIVEMNKKSSKDYKEIVSEVNIPTKAINDVVHSVIGTSLNVTLKNIGIHPFLFPSTKYIKDSSRNLPLSYVIASLSQVSGDGHLTKGGDDGFRAWYFQNYERHQGLIIHVYLTKIFKKIMEEQSLNKENLLLYFRETNLFPENTILLIDVALDRYFAEDYVSAFHILVPQFESFFLFVSEKIGIDVISLNRGTSVSTQPKVLSSLSLQSLEFQKVWGEDLCNQIDFVLFEPLGYKLRHKVAHGGISINECTFETTTLLIQLFLTVSARVSVKR